MNTSTKVVPLFFGKNIEKYEFPFQKKEYIEKKTLLISFLNLIPIFRVVSSQERNALTICNSEGKRVDWERQKPETYETADGFYEILGPVLCTYDFKVFCALMHIFLEAKNSGIMIDFTLSHLAKILYPSYNEKPYRPNVTHLKPSLERLQKIYISKTSCGTNSYLSEFYGPIISKNKNQFELNQYFVKHFVNKAYSIVNLDVILDLNPYELKLYTYLVSRGFKKAGLDYKISTIFKVIYSNESNYSHQYKLTKIGITIKSLIAKGLLQPYSGLKKSSSWNKESHYLLHLV